MKKKAIFGSGGHAREFVEFSGMQLDVFVDDQFITEGLIPISAFDPEVWSIMVCVGDSEQRKSIVDRLPVGTEFFTYVHPTALVGDNVEIGQGSYVGPYCIITTNARIGNHALLNRHVQISHDCTIGDFFSAMPGSTISGDCNIGDSVYLGTNSSIRQKIKVCSSVTLGMGSALINDADTAGKYVGVPACRKVKLSIIIPCYNFGKYITQAIESALSQKSNFVIEVIVGDDCSTDDSYEVIKRYSNQIKHFRSETNQGPYLNIKKLVDMSQGEYISYLDGDDFLIDPLKSQKQIDFLENNPEYSMHSTGCIYGNEDGTQTEVHIHPLMEEVTINELVNTNLVGFGRTFRNYRKTIKEWMRDVYYLDWCFNLELSLMGKIKCESWPSGVYRITGNGMITSKTQEEAEILNNQCREEIRKRIEYYKYEL